MGSSGRTVAGVVLLLIALIAIAAGVVYLTMSAHNIPTFFPGHIASATATGHRSKRGAACLAFGVVVLIISVVVMASGRRRYRY